MTIKTDYQKLREESVEKTLKYSLIESNFHKNFIYGISIEKINYNNTLEEFEQVLEITDNLELIKLLFSKIKNYLVTPVTLVNIVDDFISEYL